MIGGVCVCNFGRKGCFRVNNSRTGLGALFELLPVWQGVRNFFFCEISSWRTCSRLEIVMEIFRLICILEEFIFVIIAA